MLRPPPSQLSSVIAPASLLPSVPQVGELQGRLGRCCVPPSVLPAAAPPQPVRHGLLLQVELAIGSLSSLHAGLRSGLCCSRRCCCRRPPPLTLCRCTPRPLYAAAAAATAARQAPFASFAALLSEPKVAATAALAGFTAASEWGHVHVSTPATCAPAATGATLVCCIDIDLWGQRVSHQHCPRILPASPAATTVGFAASAVTERSFIMVKPDGVHRGALL